MQQREKRIQLLKENPEVSVLIVGAGINGIGTFRDLALQGLDVVIVDRDDYCSGASAASSHMVHGGIRYLENGEFRLVREAVRERNRLIENAPHLVKPLPTTFPIFKWLSGLLNAPFKFLGLLDRPAERGAVVIKIGMILYDYFTRKQKTVPQHVFRNRKESLALFPDLNPDIIYTGTYYDGIMRLPERIAMELIQDAAAENEKAIPLNYVSLVSAQGNTVTLKDELTGETIQVKPKILVNAAGPWIDLVNNTIGKQTHFISGTKGSHVILDHPELRQAIGENEFFFENQDGRIVLILPYRDKVMIGSSDIRINNPDEAIITESEVDYFFEMIERVFPRIKVNRSQIVYTFSGVRPLQHTEKGLTGQISRDHKVQVIEAGDLLDIPILSLVGGKWTSFRAFSEHTTDEVINRLGIQRKVSTGDLQIGGSKGYPKTEAELQAYTLELQNSYQVTPEVLERLFDTYGTKVEEILRNYGKEAKGGLDTIPNISLAEIKNILTQEDVIHLDDLLLRRTMLGKLGQVNPESLMEISRICAETFGWSQEETKEEIEYFTNLLEHKHRMYFNDFEGITYRN
jgi:glycerol-3-phosphate dehydrogenase